MFASKEAYTPSWLSECFHARRYCARRPSGPDAGEGAKRHYICTTSGWRRPSRCRSTHVLDVHWRPRSQMAINAHPASIPGAKLMKSAKSQAAAPCRAQTGSQPCRRWCSVPGDAVYVTNLTIKRTDIAPESSPLGSDAGTMHSHMHRLGGELCGHNTTA